MIGVKRALSRAGYIEWGNFTDVFGPFMETAVKDFQRHHGIPATGLYGAGSHKALVHSHAKSRVKQWAFDAESIYLMRQEAKILAVTPDKKIRSAGVAAAYYWYAHRLQTAYEEWRPFRLIKPPEVTSPWDCSAFGTNCHYAGGAPNPNGFSDGSPRPWDGQGYTGTLCNRGVSVPLSQLDPLDLILWGHYEGPWEPAFPPGSPTHVSVCVGAVNGRVMHISNGHYPMQYAAVEDFPMAVNHYRHYTVA